jgi:SCY1-like protein 2
MGNPLFKNYNVDKEPFLTGGFNNLWKIYKGSRNDRKQDVCLFVLEKKTLDNKYSKEEKEEILKVLKKEAASLAKFKHPGVLSIYDQQIEDKSSLVFVTEPVQYTLQSWIEQAGVSKLEVKLMITELCSVMRFLHDDAHVIHSALDLDNIFINPQGHIKVSGLTFSISDPSIAGSEIKLNNFYPNAMPNLKYVAPEIVNESKAYYQSDVFSIGLIIYYLLKITKGDTDRNLINLNGYNSVDAYKKSLDVMENKVMRIAFESDDNDLIFKALNKVALNRPTIKEFSEHNWFNDPKLKALSFVENLEQNDQAKNIEFLNKFPNIISFFENKIIERRFLPAFMNALKVESLIVNTLPAIFAICEDKHIKIDFEQTIWPGLKTLFGMKQIPAAGLYFLLSKLNYISEKISNTEFTSNMMNIICKALDCGVPKIQNIVLDNLLFIIKKLDSLTFRTQIYPRLVKIVLDTTNQNLKMAILKAFCSIYSLLDQTTINESLLSTIEKVRKADNSPETCLNIVNVYEEIGKVVSIEVFIF